MTRTVLVYIVLDFSVVIIPAKLLTPVKLNHLYVSTRQSNIGMLHRQFVG